MWVAMKFRCRPRQPSFCLMRHKAECSRILVRSIVNRFLQNGGEHMPGCVLRVAGASAKVKKFLHCGTLEPSRVYWRGDPGFPASRGPVRVSGFNVPMSGSHGGSIARQAQQVQAFLRQHRGDMLLIRDLRFKYVTADFGLNDLATEERPWPTYRVPASLIQLLGEFRFEVELSFYGPLSSVR